ncbi:MAG: hypothetical protein J0H31_06155 [Alphaproteobacteria bacterium]|nr:hypothetical protein [Alphaproteobacteria bacterium]
MNGLIGLKRSSVLVAISFAAWASAHAAESGRPAALAAYAGKYPFDLVNGVSFRENKVVVAAVKAAVAGMSDRAELIQLFLSPGQPVDTPIALLSDGRIYSRSFDPASGGETNWAILITKEQGEDKAALCLSDNAVYGDGFSDWYFDGYIAFSTKGPCPSEKEEIEKAIGQWPAGPRPN